MKSFVRCGILIAAIATCTGAFAADPAANYPARPIRLVVPYPPGGPSDIMAHEVGPRLSDAWGQPVVVDNRPGAGSVVAHNIVAHARPDGYTLLIGASAGLVLNPLLQPKIPYDAATAFAPISTGIVGPHVLVANPSLNVNSVKELVALAKARPGKLDFGSAGVGSATFLAGAMFRHMAGIDVVHVPYHGGAPALLDIAAGRIQFMFNSIPGVLPFVHSGRLKLLAVGSPKRLALFPDVPTVAETLPGYQSQVWYCFVAPAGTPRAIIRKINLEVVKILALPTVRQHLTAVGVIPEGSTPEALGHFIAKERARWKRVIAEINAKP